MTKDNLFSLYNDISRHWIRNNKNIRLKIEMSLFCQCLGIVHHCLCGKFLKSVGINLVILVGNNDNSLCTITFMLALMSRPRFQKYLKTHKLENGHT